MVVLTYCYMGEGMSVNGSDLSFRLCLTVSYEDCRLSLDAWVSCAYSCVCVDSRAVRYLCERQ